MKEQITLQGRSMVFNILMVALNLTGLTFLVLGYHDNFEDNSTLYRLVGLTMLIASIGGIVILKGRLMMSSVARVLVGGLFIVSGLVKANDPLGFSYKLEEYFEDGALAFRIKEWFGAPGFSMEYFIDFALFLSVLICIAEIVLGVLTIIGGKIKLVSYLMLFMMLFFTFLTWHTTNCDGEMRFTDRDTYQMSDPIAATKIEEANSAAEEAKKAKTANEDYTLAITIVSQSESELVVDEVRAPQCVSDCGCFGDAMKGSVGRSLSPKESFWKDIVLVYLVLWIFVGQWITKPNTRKQNMVFISTSVLMIVFFSWVFGWYFPVFFGIVAILGALWILRAGGKYLGNYYGSALFVAIICLFVTTYVLMYLPLKDYRPYAVGSDLNVQMNDGIPRQSQDSLVYVNKNNGKMKMFEASSDAFITSKIWEDKAWEYDTIATYVIVEGKLPTIDSLQFNPYLAIEDVSKYELELDAVEDQMMIKGLKILDKAYNTEMNLPITEYNVTDYDTASYSIVDTINMPDPYLIEVSILKMILNSPKVVIVSSLTLNGGAWGNIERLKAIHAECKMNNIPFAVICGASREDVAGFREKYKFYAPIFGNDGTELKAVSRSNPSLLVIENGVVKAKYPYRSIPTKDSFIKIHIK